MTVTNLEVANLPAQPLKVFYLDVFVGKAISSLDLKRHPQTLILAIPTEDGWLYNPHRDYVVGVTDTLVYISTPEGKDELERFLHAAQ